MIFVYNIFFFVRYKYGFYLVFGLEDNMDDDDQDLFFGIGFWRDQDIVVRKKFGFLRFGKKYKFFREGEMNFEYFMGLLYLVRQFYSNVVKLSKYVN